MSTLTHTLKQQLQARLEQRQVQLQQELVAVQQEREAHADNNDFPPEPDANQSRESIDREVRHAEQLRDQHELQAVKAALQRIADGSYGECVGCGKNIAPERLQASPAAARCIDCQAQAEAKT